jgi:2-C-methyl-D-erythritol 4-phosphate cytidylyltransferase
MSSGRHSIQTEILTIHTRENYLLQIGKELVGVSEKANQKTVEQTGETASEHKKSAKIEKRRQSVQSVLKMSAKNTAIFCVSDANRTNVRLQ